MGVRIREKDGAWWVYVNHRGKRKAKRVGVGTAGKKAAQQAAVQIEARLALGDVGILEQPKTIPQAPSFETVAWEWEKVTSPSWKRGTVITYDGALRHRLLPVFGALRVSEITESLIEHWWAKTRADGLSKRYLDTLRSLLTDILKRAVRQGHIRTNPAECIEGGLGRQDVEPHEADYLVPEDLTKLLDTAKIVTPKEYPIFLTMATAGLRIGEAVGLQVGDLDALNKQVHIRRTVRRGYISSPKNGKGRVVDVPPSTVAVLEGVRQTRQAEAAYSGVEARWLFPGEADGMPITPEEAQGMFRKLLRVAGLRKIRPHDLRHTYATLAIQAGVPVHIVSRQLGHASISTTCDIYRHSIPGEGRACADAMEAILTRQQPGATPAQPRPLTR
jgi:integrase